MKDCAAMLDQSLEEVKAAKDLITALKDENESRKNLTAIQKGIIENQDKIIVVLAKQNRRK
ncbi:MAG TPA: hypothetical protein VNI84_18845, partial [Pyrinomonadaceae bacterium]|nr:hypothetical protein [Pyrinomonadaceae bacterium]